MRQADDQYKDLGSCYHGIFTPFCAHPSLPSFWFGAAQPGLVHSLLLSVDAMCLFIFHIFFFLFSFLTHIPLPSPLFSLLVFLFQISTQKNSNPPSVH
jgi:hypothetical protein